MKRIGIRVTRSHDCPGFRKFHPGYSLLVLLVNIVMVWMFSFCRWPKVASQAKEMLE